jgi:ribose/xylose/arabinose/galactoside ABC-type transport system permease subunit
VIVSERTTDNPGLDNFLYLGQGQLFDVIPIMAFFLIIVGIIGYVIFNRTLLGFRLRAVGGNTNAAKASGIHVNNVKIAAFAITGVLAAFAGILNMAFITNVRADSGAGLELITIASVIIGGTSISGGEGTILGTIIGVLIIGTLRNGLVLLGVSPFWQTLVIGVVIIGAVAMDIWMRRDKSKS